MDAEPAASPVVMRAKSLSMSSPTASAKKKSALALASEHSDSRMAYLDAAAPLGFELDDAAGAARRRRRARSSSRRRAGRPGEQAILEQVLNREHRQVRAAADLDAAAAAARCTAARSCSALSRRRARRQGRRTRRAPR